ncbi:UNVERIFIED_CONTAM: hypothetical protein K2H54_033387 [Gekko kuhli]
MTRLGKSELLVGKVFLAPRAPEDSEESLAERGHLEAKDQKGTLGVWGHLAHRESGALQASKVHKAREDLRAQKASLDSKAARGASDSLVPKGKQAQRVMWGLLGRTVHLGQLELLGHQEVQESQANQAHQAQLGPQGQKGILGYEAGQGSQDHLGPQDHELAPQRDSGGCGQ